MGTVDGPGLRFVIFLQGCNFKCLYCANPDTIETSGGTRISEDEIFRMVNDMKPYFGRRGGVTFSGGEPTLQAKALIPLIERFKGAGIHTCIDSNGGAWSPMIERLYSLVDLVLLDVKHIDSARHEALTAHTNEQTLRTAEWMEAHSRPFWLRYVLVLGVNSDTEYMEAWAARFSAYKMVERVEVLPYHRLGVHKYEAMGWEYPLPDTKECSPELLAEVESIMTRHFDTKVIVA